MTPTSEGHVPVRTCVGCGRRRPAAELVRVALAPAPHGPAGVVVSRRAPGRGAWLCGVECLAQARRRRGFQRAWRTDVEPIVLDLVERLLHGEARQDGRSD